MIDRMNIPIAKLKINESLVVREIDKEHIDRLANSDSSQWPPLKVIEQENGNYLVLGGIHRLLASETMGLDIVECELLQEPMTENQMRLVAYADNIAHGKPLSIKERKTYAQLLHKEDMSLSLRAIGRMTNLDHHTVSSLLNDRDAQDTNGDTGSQKKTRTRVTRLVDSILTTPLFYEIHEEEFSHQAVDEIAQHIEAEYDTDDESLASYALVLRTVAMLLDNVANELDG